MKSINGKGFGDLYIRFLVNMPNLNNLDNETKQKYKTLFKSFDQTEAANETNILNNKAQYTKVNFLDCKEKETQQIHQLFLNNKEETREDEAPPREQQCVHQ